MTITVTQLNRYIKNKIENDIHLTNITVKGEISNFKNHSSGHLYLTIKDETSAIRAVMFRGSATKLKFAPENGMKVICEGKVSVYERDGQYQLYINAMQPDGIGDLHVAFEQLKEKLHNEGLFEQSRKKAIPKFPKTVGVITSPTGAAVRDIVNVISRRNDNTEILICPVLVQGENAAPSIKRAIEYMNNKNLADVIILGRGGGSIEDLWAFNEEIVAYAIADSNIPIISAVGHETDFSISDFVADLRAPTPSAAAELAVTSKAELKQYLNQNFNRMLNAIKKEIETKRAVLNRFKIKEPTDILNQHRMRIDTLIKQIQYQTNFKMTKLCQQNESLKTKLENLSSNIYEKKKNEFMINATKLNSLNPLSIITRGFSVATINDKVVKSINQINKNDKILLRLKDGIAKCIVDELEGETK